MSKHTPGPWRVSGVNNTDIEADSNSTFWAWVSVDTPEDERKPNARLIAAAPDLLETLVMLRDTLPHVGLQSATRVEMLRRINSAISKAEGVQP